MTRKILTICLALTGFGTLAAAGAKAAGAAANVPSEALGTARVLPSKVYIDQEVIIVHRRHHYYHHGYYYGHPYYHRRGYWYHHRHYWR